MDRRDVIRGPGPGADPGPKARVVLLARVVGREFGRMVERRGVFAVRLGGRPVPEATMQSLLSLIYLSLVVLAIAALALSALTLLVILTPGFWKK